MPELPEVETIIKDLSKILPGLKIRDVWCNHKKMIKKPKSFNAYKKELIGKKILKLERKGKNILINLSSNKTLLIHQKMTGHFLYGEWQTEKDKPIILSKGPIKDDQQNRFIHLIFYLSNGKQLALSDLRKFAKTLIWPTDKLDELSDINKIGPDPTDKTFTFKKFMGRIKTKHGKIKTVLMDQEIIAGVGNIYSDEILWLAGVHPLKSADRLNEKELKAIYKAIGLVLKKAIKARGTSDSDFRDPAGKKGNFQNMLSAYRLTGTKCKKKDEGIIKRIKVGSRSAHFCSAHQKV